MIHLGPEVDRIVDIDMEEIELRILAHADCSWCTNIGTVWLMGGLYCETCADKFRNLHAAITTKKPYDVENH